MENTFTNNNTSKNEIKKPKIKDNKNFEKILWTILSYVLLLTIWQSAVSFTNLGRIIPGPISVLLGLVQSISHPIGKYTLFGHIGWSLMRAMVGFSIGSIIGMALGLYMGWYKIGEAIFKPFFEIMRPIPPLAWIPISILWFGIGETAKFFIITLAVFTAVTLNSYAGVRRTDKVLVGAAKMLGASEKQIFFHVALRSSVPAIFAGLQISLGASWNAMLAAEMVRSTEGLGWLIITGMETYDMNQIFIGIIAIAIVGYLIISSMRWAEMWLCRWSGVK